MVEAGPKGKLAFRYLLSQFSTDFYEILLFVNPRLFPSHLASILKISYKILRSSKVRQFDLQ